MRKCIYVAGPYSDPTRAEREENVVEMMEAGNLVYNFGGAPFLPLLCHYWDIYSPKDYEAWMDIVTPWVLKADAVYRMPGHSKGAELECKLAVEHNIPVLWGRGSLADFLK